MSDQIKQFLEETVYAVEANRFEYMSLWKDYSKNYEWVEILHGYGQNVGYLADRPVFISLQTAIVNGRKILFYEATSEVVDWRMIAEWLEKNMPLSCWGEDGRLNKTDADNFRHAIWA